jgi:anti-anti-sigma factor
VVDADQVSVRVAYVGRVCVLSVSGELDLICADRFAERAWRLADGQAERLVLDLSGLVFADCAGARQLAGVTGIVPDDCPVVVRSARPAVRRVLELMGLDLESARSRADRGRPRRPGADGPRAAPGHRSGAGVRRQRA